MKLRYVHLVFLTAIHISVLGQADVQDSLIQELAFSAEDTNRVRILNGLCIAYHANRPDSALYYGYKGLMLSRQINYPKGEVMTMRNISLAHSILGNSTEALQLYLQALQIAEENNIIDQRAMILVQLGILYSKGGNYDKAIELLQESKIWLDSLKLVGFWMLADSYIAESYLHKNRLDSALLYIESAHEKARDRKSALIMNRALITYGRINQLNGNSKLALAHFRESLSFAKTRLLAFNGNMAIAQLFKEINEPDSSIYYAKRSLELAQTGGILSGIIDANLLLSELFQNRNSTTALQYSRMVIAYKDSLENLRNSTALDAIAAFDEQERQFELETARTQYQNRLRMNAFVGVTFTFLVIAIFLYRNNKVKQKAKQKIEEAYDRLKSTQSQLIQSEKMASLGELTAGIAHEIQNPLNFVNNFSEVNTELVEELRQELDKGELDEVRKIAKDIEENEQKIKHHGQRAESIVKGMLQHSRTNSGEKVLTDINKLADEYLRLAYHGMRAKDKSFTAEFKTDFDPDLPKIYVIPQDIGRVLLNLFNNAFYACTERSRSAGSDYQPMVKVTTKILPLTPLPDGQAGSRGGQKGIDITVSDNGDGIPEQARDKIFQPFFTTKPAGEGTGLGLSLSYDIITKGHNGHLEVDTEKGMGTRFIIQLPIV